MGRLSIEQKANKLAKEKEKLRRDQERIEQREAFIKRQSRELEKEMSEKERKARTHRLIVIGGAVESVLGRPIPEEDVDLLIAFLKNQDRRGNYFTRAMTRAGSGSSAEVTYSPEVSPEDV